MSNDECGNESTVIVHSTTVVTSYGGDSPQGGGGSLNKVTVYTPRWGHNLQWLFATGELFLHPPTPAMNLSTGSKISSTLQIKQDEEGFPSFALINKENGRALKHAPTPDPVILAPFCPHDDVDESPLWSHSQLFGDGFRTIRKVTNIRHNLDAWVGGEEEGIVRDGSKIVLIECRSL